MEETILLETNEKVNLKWDRTGKRIIQTLQLLCWNFSVVCQVEWVAYFPPWQCFLQRLRSSLKSCRFHSWEHQRERINSRPLQKLSCPQLLSVACCPLLTSVMPRYHLLPSVASYYPLLPPVVLLPSAALCRPLLPSGAGWMGLMVTDVDACDELTSCFPATWRPPQSALVRRWSSPRSCRSGSGKLCRRRDWCSPPGSSPCHTSAQTRKWPSQLTRCLLHEFY